MVTEKEIVPTKPGALNGSLHQRIVLNMDHQSRFPKPSFGFLLRAENFHGVVPAKRP